MPDHLSIWVIYDHPRDFPRDFVVREQRVKPGGAIWLSPIAWCAPTLEEARKKLPNNLFPMGRQPGDDPAIAEVWNLRKEPTA